MKHAPATIKGMNRRRIIHAIENGIRVIIITGALLIFCTFVTCLFVCVGVG